MNFWDCAVPAILREAGGSFVTVRQRAIYGSESISPPEAPPRGATLPTLSNLMPPFRRQSLPECVEAVPRPPSNRTPVESAGFLVRAQPGYLSPSAIHSYEPGRSPLESRSRLQSGVIAREASLLGAAGVGGLGASQASRVQLENIAVDKADPRFVIDRTVSPQASYAYGQSPAAAATS